MKLSDLKLFSLEWQQGKEGKFRLTKVEKTKSNNWLYTFKYESGEWFEVILDKFNKLISIIK